MAISRREALKHHISYGTGTLNHGNDSIVYDRALRKFPEDQTFSQREAAIEAGNPADAAPLAHAFQHLCATLAFSNLYVACQPIIEALDAEELPAAEDFEHLKASYQDIAGFLKSA